jgi:hypothetical protein
MAGEGCTIVISAEDCKALDLALEFARRRANDTTPRTPESDGRWVIDRVREWHKEKRNAVLDIWGF